MITKIYNRKDKKSMNISELLGDKIDIEYQIPECIRQEQCLYPLKTSL